MTPPKRTLTLAGPRSLGDHFGTPCGDFSMDRVVCVVAKHLLFANSTCMCPVFPNAFLPNPHHFDLVSLNNRMASHLQHTLLHQTSKQVHQSCAAEAELGSLFFNSKEAAATQTTLIESNVKCNILNHLQLSSPQTAQQCRSKAIDMRQC